MNTRRPTIWGYDVQFSPSGAWQSTSELTGSDSYASVLPGINIRHAITPDLTLRGAVTRTPARPNYRDLIPARTFDDQNNLITIGNSSLLPTYSSNYTFTDSSAVFPARPERATLPGQSRHVGNVAVSYEKSGFSGRIAMNFHGSYIDQVAAIAGVSRSLRIWPPWHVQER